MKRYELSFQKNIRDLGGLKTVDGRFLKEGRLFRGGALARVNEDDVKVIDSFHLTDIVDFRGEEEFLHRPDHIFDGVEYHNFPIIEEKVKDPKQNDDGNLLWFREKALPERSIFSIVIKSSSFPQKRLRVTASSLSFF